MVAAIPALWKIGLGLLEFTRLLVGCRARHFLGFLQKVGSKMMRRRASKRPPPPLRWNPPPNVRRARRNRRNALAAAAVLLVAGGATALRHHRSSVGELGSSTRASAPAEPVGRASLTGDRDKREASPAVRNDTQPDTSP